jgi:hypothetical protein
MTGAHEPQTSAGSEQDISASRSDDDPVTNSEGPEGIATNRVHTDPAGQPLDIEEKHLPSAREGQSLQPTTRGHQKRNSNVQQHETSASKLHSNDEISSSDTPVAADQWPNEKTSHGLDTNGSAAVPVVLRFKKGRRGKYVPLPEQKLRNNLSGAVGYLEFANALDFAANVWNTIPVPTFAAALMGLGGATAIILSFFAMRDGVKAWRNVKLLRGERADLKSAARDHEKAARSINGYDLDVKIEVNRRELGQEIVDRFAMDIFMGFSSLIVGIGTLLAIGGANPRVYHASNLLSGYIGNSPSAFWGLGNTLWSAYLFRRAKRHYTTGTRDLKNEAIKIRLKKRTTAVRLHSFLMGAATLVSAPAGIITATMWQGYPPLIPCIILAKWGNVIWRQRLGYTRFPISASAPSIRPDDLIKELEWTIAVQAALMLEKKKKSSADVNGHRGQEPIVMFMSKCGLIEYLTSKLIDEGHIQHESKDVIRIDAAHLERLEQELPSFSLIASCVLQHKGTRALAYRERYLLELLGASVYDAAIRRQKEISYRQTTRG